MFVEFPDYFAPHVGSALVVYAVKVIRQGGYVPAFLHQFEVLWRKGFKYDSDCTFWESINNYAEDMNEPLRKAGLL